MSAQEAKNILENTELGKNTVYECHYSPDKLFPIPRQTNRREIGLNGKLPFIGCDIWNLYELSWLNQKGKPMAAVAQITYSADSINIIESKSMKLYFNSFNHTQFKDVQTVEEIIKKDFEKLIGSHVEVDIMMANKPKNKILFADFYGKCLDDLDIACSVYDVDPLFLKTEDEQIEEILYSHLLKSNCPVTGQPDWGSLQIIYKGKKINHAGLLQYIVSFRNHCDFHEHCIERIFMDMMHFCQPEELTVYGRYTRRGGLDINPFRSTKHVKPTRHQRLCRQ